MECIAGDGVAGEEAERIEVGAPDPVALHDGAAGPGEGCSR
jgi:hypothetical protein